MSFIEWTNYLTGYVSSLCIVAAALIITEGVFVRKVFDVSTIWQIEMSIFMLIFATFMSAPYVQKKDSHLNVDFLIMYMPPKIREIMLLFGSLFTMAVAGIIAWYSWPMWWEAVVKNYHSESLWGPPLWIPYFFAPFGMSFLVLQYLISIPKKIAKIKAGQIENDFIRTELKDVDLPSHPE